ncbi:MAG: MBL fold metallo-hydrolase [Patescibacteria group bacterium]|nr:MBL fold metallo-hydrolase [Patescibacteria group bacterium]
MQATQQINIENLKATLTQYVKLAFVLIAATALILGTNFWVNSQLPKPKAQFIALDVGQGDALLFRGTNGTTVLIDGGSDDSLLWKVSEFLPYFDRQIDLMLVTHPHEDHYAGFIDLLDRYNVKKILLPAVVGGDYSYQTFLERAQRRAIPVIFAGADNDWQIDKETTLDILYPFTNKAFRTRDYNNASIVARFTHCAVEKLNSKNQRNCTSVLLTGDAGKAVESQLLENDINVKSDILKVGHHGSDTSSSQEFLNAVQMQRAIISVGKDNKFGHPNESTIQKLEKTVGQKQIYRTDKLGNIDLFGFH